MYHFIYPGELSRKRGFLKVFEVGEINKKLNIR